MSMVKETAFFPNQVVIIITTEQHDYHNYLASYHAAHMFCLFDYR